MLPFLLPGLEIFLSYLYETVSVCHRENEHTACGLRHSGQYRGLNGVGGGVQCTEVGDGVLGSLDVILVSAVGGSVVSWLMEEETKIAL